MVKSTLGSRIVQARQSKKLTGSQLAAQIGVSTQTLEDWENDQSEPKAQKILKLAGALQVPMIWVMTGEMPEAYEQPLDFSETADIAQRLERALSMQRELGTLLMEISGDVLRLQAALDNDKSLAA